ncbi:hypothetical protein V6Z90_010158 [Aspergillus fumigatus]
MSSSRFVCNKTTRSTFSQHSALTSLKLLRLFGGPSSPAESLRRPSVSSFPQQPHHHSLTLPSNYALEAGACTFCPIFFHSQSLDLFLTALGFSRYLPRSTRPSICSQHCQLFD